MHKILLGSALVLAISASAVRADTNITIAPTVDAWVATQPDSGVVYEGDIVVGTELPGTVTYVDVPDSPDLAFVYVNKKRVVVEKKTRKVVKVYE